jgi:hypothetical protein
MSHCPHCNGKDFEIGEVEVAGAKLQLVQCSGCKAPVGVLEAEAILRHVNDLEQKIIEALRVVVSSLQQMNARLDRIERPAER